LEIRPIIGLVEQMLLPVLNDQEFAIFDSRQGVMPGIACEPRFRLNERRGKFGVGFKRARPAASLLPSLPPWSGRSRRLRAQSVPSVPVRTS